MQRGFAAAIDHNINQGGGGHSAQRCQPRQDAARPGREFAAFQLAADLQPHQQEEQGHQPVIDPVMDAEAADIGMQRIEIGGRQG